MKFSVTAHNAVHFAMGEGVDVTQSYLAGSELDPVEGAKFAEAGGLVGRFSSWRQARNSPRGKITGWGSARGKDHGGPYGREFCTASAYRNLRREHRSGRRPQDNPLLPSPPVTVASRLSFSSTLGVSVASSTGEQQHPFSPFIQPRKLGRKWTNCPVIVLFRLFPFECLQPGDDRVIICFFLAAPPNLPPLRHPENLSRLCGPLPLSLRRGYASLVARRVSTVAPKRGVSDPR